MKNQRRVVIENISPQINGGEFSIKRVVGEIVSVNVDLLVDGHDVIAGSVLYKHEKEKIWRESRLNDAGEDNWTGSFIVEKQGVYEYKIEGWVDYALNWRYGTIRKIDDHQHVSSELLEGVEYLNKLLKVIANKSEKEYILRLQYIFKNTECYNESVREVKSEDLYNLFLKYPEKKLSNESEKLSVYVDRLKARFSTWYEFFPRSASQIEGVHGTFKDCENLLSRVSQMGFDTLYFPPIHPIGEVNRKGKNNTTTAYEGDVGSCWGIGSKEGGHTSIHPQLGTLDEFKSLIWRAKEIGIEIAMDYALQVAPDHPWVTEHPKWFKWRPDGTVQYAENPPKKYQDILPVYFETKEYEKLWDQCLSDLIYWIECGVNVFRIDNPHTKPYYFWNWIISKIKNKYPDVIFLAEAFTKPKVMHQLGKQGFTQSYTYFAWRNNKHELTEYVEQLTKTDIKEFMRPNFWPNTPDINPFHLQGANESKHIQRYVLAATLSSNVGIYGPVFEQMISGAILGKEEYINSEKFQICKYNWHKENKVTHIISLINNIRSRHEALQQTNNIKFCNIDNDQIIAFYKWNDDKTSEILVVISLDDHYMQQGWLQLPLHELGIWKGHNLTVTDLITHSAYEWADEYNFIELHPSMSFHIFAINK
ncbi:alpha-1,4-glucan--maltose-1-phosphate maltosyltransferase [Lutibacter citreus]|uniref:alpha-1,4-glucan--maltose-1-phosphate maltosyltransferase n=1 Tax=Lutibacter citreus TaxID=2138210 RepID=UPI000DBE5C38|nr:alpha-1,4-glucan--maltose-1-phosphate maltosyltransferase [Lutibacter citreus]